MGIELARAFVTVSADASQAKSTLDNFQSSTTKSLMNSSNTVDQILAVMSDGIDRQRAVLGVSAEQLARHALESQGASKSQMALYDSMVASGGEINKQSAAIERGQALTRQVAESTKGYTGHVADLDDLLKRHTITQDTYNAALSQLKNQNFQQLASQISQVTGSVAVMGGVMTMAFGGAASAAIMAAGKFEQTTIAFSTMLGSAEKAGDLLEKLTKFAAATPFEMPEIEQVSRGLVMFGEDSKTLMQTLTMLGNAASGTSSSFGMIGLVYNQIRGVGHLLTQDFRQLSTRGVISLRDIAAHYKITDAAAQDMISKGKISFNDFREIMLELTGGSGRFSNMMEKQSKSMLGMLSTFNDAWRITLRQIGEEITPIGKVVMGAGISTLEMFSSMDKGSKLFLAGSLGLGAVVGGLVTSITGMVFVGVKLVSAYTSMSSILTTMAATSRAAAAAQWSLNAAMTAGKVAFGLTGIAIAGLVGYNLGNWLEGQSEAGKKMAEMYEKLGKDIADISVAPSFKGQSTAGLEKYLKNVETLIAESTARVAAQEKDPNAKGAESLKLEKKLLLNLTDLKKKAQDELSQHSDAKVNDKEVRDKKIKSAREEYDALLKEAKDLDEKMKGNTKLATPLAFDPDDQGKTRRARIQARKELEEDAAKKVELDAKLRMAGERQRSLVQAKKTAEDPADEKKTAKAKEETEKLKEKADTWKMNADQAAAYKMKVEKVSAAEILLNQVERGRERALKVDDIVEKYEKEARAVGKTKDELELLKISEDKSLGLNNNLEDMGDQLERIRQKLSDLRVAEAIQAMQTPAQKLQATYAGIARDSGVGTEATATRFAALRQSTIDALNPLKALGDKIEELKIHFVNGLSVDDARRAMAGLVDGFGDAIDPADALAKQFDNLARQFGAGSMEYGVFAERLGKGVRDSLDPHRQLNAEVARLTAMMKGGAFSGNEAENVRIYDAAILNLGKSARESVNPFLALQTRVAEFKNQLDQGVLGEGAAGLEVFKKLVASLGDSVRASVDPLFALDKQIEQLDAQLKAGAFGEGATGLDLYNKAVANLGKSVRDSVNPVAALASKMEELDALRKRNAISEWEYGQAVRAAKVAAGFELGAGKYGMADLGKRFQDIMLKPTPPGGFGEAGKPKDRQNDMVDLMGRQIVKQDEMIKAVKEGQVQKGMLN